MTPFAPSQIGTGEHLRSTHVDVAAARPRDSACPASSIFPSSSLRNQRSDTHRNISRCCGGAEMAARGKFRTSGRDLGDSLVARMTRSRKGNLKQRWFLFLSCARFIHSMNIVLAALIQRKPITVAEHPLRLSYMRCPAFSIVYSGETSLIHDPSLSIWDDPRLGSRSFVCESHQL